MSVLAAACFWLVAANVAGMIPSRTGHRRRAGALVLTCLPLAVWVLVAAGPIWGAAFAVAAASILRWPLLVVIRRVVLRGR